MKSYHPDHYEIILFTNVFYHIYYYYYNLFHYIWEILLMIYR